MRKLSYILCLSLSVNYAQAQTRIGSNAVNISQVRGLTDSLAAKESFLSAGLINQYLRGDKTWQTLDKSAVGLGNVNNTADVNKPVSTATQTALDTKEPTINSGSPGQYFSGNKTWENLPITYSNSDWQIKWDSTKNANGIHDFDGYIRADNLQSDGQMNVSGDSYIGGTFEVENDAYFLSNVEIEELTLKNAKLHLPTGHGVTGQVMKNNYNGNMVWGDVIDTLGGRPVLPLPAAAAGMIPESSHLVIEPDFLKARSSGNSYFDTLRLDYSYYNILKDSVELVLPDFSGDSLKSDVYFNITFFGSDDDHSLFVYDVDSSGYGSFVIDGNGVQTDSFLVNYISSVLYFSDSVWYKNRDETRIHVSNYMASNHPLSPFQIPPTNRPFIYFSLLYSKAENKYYIQ